jgi:hypothetical protein
MKLNGESLFGFCLYLEKIWVVVKIKLYYTQPRPDVLPHGLKPKKKWDLEGPLKRANWKTIVPQKMSEKAFWVKVSRNEL